MFLDITYAYPNVFISNSACEKTQRNSMPPRRKLSDLDRGRAIRWHNCTHTLDIRWNHIKIWDHSIQNSVFGTSVNSWSLTYFEYSSCRVCSSHTCMTGGLCSLAEQTGGKKGTCFTYLGHCVHDCSPCCTPSQCVLCNGILCKRYGGMPNCGTLTKNAALRHIIWTFCLFV